MPVLMIALVALAVFGVIGILLLTAMILETRCENAHHGVDLDQTALAGRKH